MLMSGWRTKLIHKLPKPETLFASRYLKPFAPYFNYPHFWSLTRRKVCLAFAIGLFAGLMPGPTQMVTAFILAYLLRTNLAVATVTTLYTNPITYVPLYAAAYKIGWLLLTGGAPRETLVFPSFQELSWQDGLDVSAGWFIHYGKPLLLGVPVLGLSLAVLGYFVLNGLWTRHVRRIWRKRHQHKSH